MNLSAHLMAGGRNRSPRFAEGGETQAIIPIEKRSRGIPAGREMGLAFGSPTTNNNSSQTVNLSPNINAKFRQIVEDVLRNLQDDMQRVIFA